MPALGNSLVFTVTCVAAAGAWFLGRPILHVYRAERAVLHPPIGTVPFPSDSTALGIRRLTIANGSMSIAAWYAPPKSGGTIILCTGTSANRTALLYEARMLIGDGHGVLLFDWPGHGESTGDVRIDSAAKHALQSVLSATARLPGVDPMRLGVLAFSFGGVTAVPVIATTTAIRAVVLVGTPIDLVAQARYESRAGGWVAFQSALLFWRLRGQPLESLAIADDLPALAPRPVMVIGGALDRVVPPGDAAAIVQGIGSSATLWMVPSAGHGNYAAVAPEYGRKLAEFFTRELTPVEQD